MKIDDYRELFERASPTYRVTPSAPPMMVFHGVNDTLVPVEVARQFVERLRAVSQAPVAYVELPRTQHAFDVLASIRCAHTTMGAVRFLERSCGPGIATLGRAPPDREGGRAVCSADCPRSARQSVAFMT